MIYGASAYPDDEPDIATPGSPPGMSSSKSSKTSSLQSFHSDDGDHGALADAGHFEEIGLDDDTATADSSHARDFQQQKSNPNPYSASFASDLRAANSRHVGQRTHPIHPRVPSRDGPRHHPPREITTGKKPRPPFLAVGPQFRDTSTHNLTIAVGPEPQRGPLPLRGMPVRSASTLSVSRRRRSPSPNHESLGPRRQNSTSLPRRSSWQTNRERKGSLELEKECDEDDGDDIPDGFILDNVPLSPRPPTERSASRPTSTSTSPERSPNQRVRSVGNGTPAVAVASGSLKSPTWKTDGSPSTAASGASSPTKERAKSWTAAISALNAEAKALTEKLEEHADELDQHGVYHTHMQPPAKPRVKSAFAELPPLRRTNIMIDPLPVSKEKEAVLSRTRPSWLPPKDPAEEKRHIREYQRMMASSIEADKKREATIKEKERLRDKAANELIHMWEEGILKRWDTAVRERRTRELWWKGVAPRCRGAVWARAIGNELGLNETSFQAALSRAREVEARAADGKATTEDERRMAWFAQIQADVQEHTWVDLRIFQTGGPLHGPLVDVLRAYAMYRSDIGYVSGCNVSLLPLSFFIKPLTADAN